MGRRLEALKAEGARAATTDPDEATILSAARLHAKLEKRFGESHRHHKARAPEYERAPAPVREAVAGLRELERRQWRREDHARAVHQAQAARACVDALRWQGERARANGEAFGRALGEVYARPEAARVAFAETAREHGPEHAARSMRERPESFGQLRAEERRRLLGIIRTQDTSAARQRAGNAAELGRQAAEVRAPHARELARAAVLSRHMEERAQAIGRTLAQAPDLTRTRAAVGLALQPMLPQEAAELARWLSAPQQQTAQQLVRAVGRLMPEDMRKLVDWVRAPHQALAAGSVRAFKGLMQDRERERGGR
jgi:hypothetical protein